MELLVITINQITTHTRICTLTQIHVNQCAYTPTCTRIKNQTKGELVLTQSSHDDKCFEFVHGRICKRKNIYLHIVCLQIS